MKRQFMLASASLIAIVLGSAAHADDLVLNNQTNVSQTGTNGTFTVNQTGASNIAGTVTGPTTGAGSALVQSGSENALSVTQSGNLNTFTGAPITAGGSVVQSGTGNSAGVTQSGN